MASASSAGASVRLSDDAVWYLVHHVFLPPKLPQKNDWKWEFDDSLMKVAAQSLTAFRDNLPVTRHGEIDLAIGMITSTNGVHSLGAVNEKALQNALGKLSGEGTSIACNIRSQNAGVVISKVESGIQFDVFELSPQNNQVMTSKGRLVRSFPGASVVVSLSDFQQPGFQDAVAHTLSSMSTEPVVGMQPKAKKAGQMHDEERDTAHPGMVSELFIGFLSSVGKPVAAPVISKNTRDDVVWHNTLSPWRRSGTWLLIRVALQLSFLRSSGTSNAYKEAMAFLMSHVLDKALDHSLPDDILYAMNAKLARRLLKLGSSIDQNSRSSINRSMQKAHQFISNHWSAIQKADSRALHLSKLAKLDFVEDARVALPGLDSYISAMSSRRVSSSSRNFVPTSSLMTFEANSLPLLHPYGFNDNTYIIPNLQAFEHWVALHCRQYSRKRNNDPKTCKDLGDLISDYHEYAQRHYGSNPELLSVMLLTIFEVWVACDEVAVHLCPLLKDYDPNVPQEVLQNVLLPFKAQLERLAAIEMYLSDRRAKAQYKSIYLYVQPGNRNSFAVRYFEQSQQHQDTLRRINEWAADERKKKLSELQDLKAKESQLKSQYESMQCEMKRVPVHDSGNVFEDEVEHKDDCKKCQCKRQMANLRIHVHEWPLSNDLDKAKAVVFELQVPPVFQFWRETTYSLLRDVLRMQYSSSNTPRASYALSSDEHLRRFSQASVSSPRIGLLSQDKPQIVVHRSAPLLSQTTETSVCVACGVNYYYYDRFAGSFVNLLESTAKIPELCTYRLPSRSSVLQKYLFRPAATPDGPPPNTVIASQSNCPDHLALEEYRTLGNLLFGSHIQLYNIPLQSKAPSIDFKKPETALIIFQAMYQAGPPNSTETFLRSTHVPFSDIIYADKLLSSLATAFKRTRENWESAQSLAIFSAISARLLSLNSHTEIKQRCLDFLKTLRRAAFGWVELLKHKAQEAPTDNERKEFNAKSAEAALICALCFDVNDDMLTTVLGSVEARSMLIQCSIILQESKQTFSQRDHPFYFLLRTRFDRLLHRAYNFLRRYGSSLDDAIRKSWPAFQGTGQWTDCSRTNGHWLKTDSKSGAIDGTLQVHYNLLNGELLVNGLPLNRPPHEYENHPMWITLFGKSAIEVMPTSVPGMQFSAKQKYKGHTIHLGRSPPTTQSNGAVDLLIRASTNGSLLEAIPPRLLRDCFPDFFVSEFVHWYNHENGVLEFRPIKTPWDSLSTKTWTLVRDATDSTWRLSKDGYMLMGTKNNTANNIARIFSPLAKPSSIHITLHPSQRSIEVDMPKLRLSFFLKSGGTSLQSKEYRGMSIDKDQSIGTFVGFANKLMLRRNTQHCCDRILLLPEGTITYTKTTNHVDVAVETNSIVKVHPLEVDVKLGRLIDKGGLQGRIYVSYIHALTAFCLPDPLTSKTGTEQALSILQLSGVRSFDKLAQNNIDTLAAIARLTPGRCFYPQNERVMQVVSWRPQLSFMSQHNDFHKIVTSIFEQANKTKIFYPDLKYCFPELKGVDDHLTARDRNRSSQIRVSGFGAEAFTAAHDIKYKSRDTQQSSSRAFNAFVFSSIIHNNFSAQHAPWVIPGKGYLWNLTCQTKTMLGADSQLGRSKMRYDAELVRSGLDISQWLAMHKYLKNLDATSKNKFSIMIWLSGLAAANSTDLPAAQVMALIFTRNALSQIDLPASSSWAPSEGYRANKDTIRTLVRGTVRELTDAPESRLQKLSREDRFQFKHRQGTQFRTNQTRAVDRLTDHLFGQWPSELLTRPNNSDLTSITDYLNLDNAMATVARKLKVWQDNLQLFEYFQRIEIAISNLSSRDFDMPRPPSPTPAVNTSRRGFIASDDLFNSNAPSLPQPADSLASLLCSENTECETYSRLEKFIKSMKRTSCASNYELAYIDELQDSLVALKERTKSSTLTVPSLPSQDLLLDHYRECFRVVDAIYSALIAAVELAPLGDSSLVSSTEAGAIGHWPRVSPTFFLQLLRRTSWDRLSADWKSCILQYGLALTALQRAERLLKAADLDNTHEVMKELKNVGHTNWDPRQLPESLLLEVESGIIIREVQTEIAEEMRHPRSGKNTVMQLNMGEGKSSVIVPMVAASLADSSQLVCVVVGRPQSKQMMHMLVDKLGSLCGRRIYHMPVSRSLRLDESSARTIDSLLRDCMSQGGVLLVQPEHILSFKLMGLECYNTNRQLVGQALVKTQDLLDSQSRYIVDESDENFNVKFELIYTMGLQQPIELSSARWNCVHQLMTLVQDISPQIAAEYPSTIEIIPRQNGGVPRIRILKLEAEKLLVDRIGLKICETGLNGFPIARQSKSVRDAVLVYITKHVLTDQEIDAVEEPGQTTFWTETTRDVLLLLRGLLAEGVLAFALGQKRWRVNYGRTFQRTPSTKLAVPYRAKDHPTHRSEFSHPDVVIALTCLSYYYDGLEDEDLFTALAHLARSDQAEIEYNTWIKDAHTMPSAFQQLEGVNTQDRLQCIRDVFPHLKYSKSVIDYFLAHVVFPREMKEFPQKLSASGWDIGKQKGCPTTGFSGTNDSRKQLPLDVEHLDIPKQKHTNALVLHHLLQTENTVISMPQSDNRTLSDAEHFLSVFITHEQPIQVILDVGAQILELNNRQVAELWLDMHPDPRMQAVVFVNDDDEVSVLDRKGRIEPLQTSSFASQLDVCLVFLDEAHTRGIDLRLPPYYRAAVTLGANLTKDKLVQACMRMRQLSRGQTVSFCLTEEINNRIKTCTSRPSDTAVAVEDVLHWAISETFKDTRRAMPIWLDQGKRFLRHLGLWVEVHKDGVTQMSSTQAEKFQEDEAQSLESRYRPRKINAANSEFSPAAGDDRFRQIEARCREFDNLNFKSSSLQEEQERELSPEIEQERQVQKPSPAQPAQHELHGDVRKFVSTGQILKSSAAYFPAFRSLCATSAAQKFQVSQLCTESLLVSADFAKTVSIQRKSDVSDQYQRPVQWILTKCSAGTNTVTTMMLISPFEAQALFPDIQKYCKVTLHIYKPRCNVGFPSFDGLDFLSIPSHAASLISVPLSLRTQLNVFAGQLYFDSYKNYLDACKFLGLSATTPQGAEVIAADGFVLQDSQGKVVSGTSPIKFLQILMSNIRRDGQGVSKTHMGSLLEGKILEESEFEK